MLVLLQELRLDDACGINQVLYKSRGNMAEADLLQ